MSTDLLDSKPRQHLQPTDQWFWPTSSLLSPLMDSNKSQSVNSSVTTTVSTTSGTYHRRHKHWWKVCWIYNNGHFIGNPSKASNLRHFQQQFSSFSMCSSNMSAIFNDRCVKRDDQIFSKPNVSPNGGAVTSNTAIEGYNGYTRGHDPSEGEAQRHKYSQSLSRSGQSEPQLDAVSMSVCAPHISSSATSGFLSQKLTQPLTALLKQRSELKNSNISQFFIDFKGSDWRAEQLQYQMPVQDIQMFKSQSNEVKFVRNQQRKAQIKPQLFLNKSLSNCLKCQEQIEIDAYVVKISVVKNGNLNNGYNTTTDDEESVVKETEGSHPSLNGSTALFHIQCFTCEECEQVLVDLKAFMHTNSDKNDRTNAKNSLYCSRHFVELYKPRCQFCDQLIFDEECTEAEGKAWHLGHFCCSECKRSLGGQQYIMADPSKQTDKKLDSNRDRVQSHITAKNKKQLPYCLTCFDILFGELCEECGELIGCDVGAITHEGRSWHASDLCFKCNLCSKTLLGKPFLPAFDGKIYCSISCSQEAIQRNRYRNRRKQRSAVNNPDNTAVNELISPKNADNCRRSEPQREAKPSYEQNHCHNTHLKQYQVAINDTTDSSRVTNQQINHSDNTQNNHLNYEQSKGFQKMFSEMQLNETKDVCDLRPSKTNDCIVAMESPPMPPNGQPISYERNSPNNMNHQMLKYLHQCQQLGKAPPHVLDYMRQQLLQSHINGQNDIIGASIEYMSSLSEDERTSHHSVEHKSQAINDIKDINYNQVTPMTSSTSSSLNANQFDAQTNSNNNNPFKCKPLLVHSSSSNETTPLLLRSLENRAKQLASKPIDSRPVADNARPMPERSMPSLPSHMKCESPSQTSSQADQSSTSSYIENNHRITDSILVKNLKPNEGQDSPSTLSTALQSTSSQTTPESNPRIANKSVSFDPNVKEPTGRRINRKPKPRSTKRSDWSDTQSCSTCSTCSSSSSSSDDDYESTLDRNRKEWLGGTKIHYVSSDRKRNISSNAMTQNDSQNNESCIIS